MDSNQFIKDEIKRAADIVEVIGQFVQLKRAGQSHIGLCPFHSEKAPSFTVSSARQMFHCFGCKKGGDVFAFWMEYHKVSFPQAMRDLADRYHISLPEKTLTPFQRGKLKLKESLFNINEEAANFFHSTLVRGKKGEPGRQYLARRGVPKKLTEDFRLGFAADEWNDLSRFLQSKGLDMETAVQAGLILPKKNGGHYDRFRGRVIFPIFNLRKQVIGFGGRVLDDSLPKYLNTPETPLFHKGKALYGLHGAFQSIRENACAVIVEGYTDVLALKKHGFKGVVATLGTALTRDHIRMLKGYAGEAVVVFDADTAGKTAAMKSLSHFLAEGLSSKVLILPEGEDPDSFVNSHGLESFRKLLDSAVPMFDFFIDLNLYQEGDRIEHKVNALKEILPVLAELESEAQRSLYTRRVAEKAGVSESAIIKELQQWLRSKTQKDTIYAHKEKEPPSDALTSDEASLLNILIHYPAAIHRLMKQDYKVLISNHAVFKIFEVAHSIFEQNGGTAATDILERLNDESIKEKFREGMLKPSIFQGDEIGQAVKEFEDRIQKIKITESKKRALKKGLKKEDIEELNRIPKYIKERWG